MKFSKKAKVKNKNSYSGRKWLGMIFLLLAVVIAFVAMPMFYANKGETAKVVTVAKNLNKGAVIEQEHVAMKEVGIYGIDGYLTDAENVIGKTAATNLLPGDIVTKNKINSKANDPIAFIQNENKRLVTVTLASNAAGLASHLKPGDIVNVYNTFEDEFGALTALPPLLSNLEVYDVENSSAVSVEDVKKQSSASASNADAIINTVTFIATEEQAAALIQAEYSGKLHVVFVKR